MHGDDREEMVGEEGRCCCNNIMIDNGRVPFSISVYAFGSISDTATRIPKEP